MQHLWQLRHAFAEQSLPGALRLCTSLFPGAVRFSTSLGQEDQVLTDIIARNGIALSLFTLDTGRLFEETYDTYERTVARYKLPIEVYFPQADAVQALVGAQGVNGFYESVAQRQACCGVRKVEPLARALKGARVWITGLRAEQNDHRKQLPVVEWDRARELYKINPLLHWSYDEVQAYLAEHNVPYNPLHDRGFISIGCAPCTRAVEPGEDPRAGRWCWEQSHKECGLHVKKR